MRVLLVRPPTETFIVSPPIGLGYLATALRRGNHHVEILDCTRTEMKLRDFVKHISSTPPFNVYGFQTYSCEVDVVAECLAMLKKLVPDAIRIIGGAHPSGSKECMTEMPNVDFAFLGEAEAGLPLFCDELEKGTRKWSSVPGLVWRNGDQLIANPRHAEANLDQLGFPAWDLMDPRTYPEAPHGGFAREFPVAPFIISRGCPYSCTFCGTKNVTGMKMRHRSTAHVLAEIRMLQRDYGVKELHIEDDNFSAVKKEMKKFCVAMIEEKVNIAWYCTSGLRLDLIDEELAGLMQQAGCYTATIAIESASQKTLDHMKKNLDLSKVPKQIAILRNAGLTLNALFILGYPTETRADMEETIRYALTLDVQRAQFSNFLPIRGTEAYEFVKQRGEIEGLDETRLHTADNPYSPPGISRSELKWLQRKAFLVFHLRPRILWNTIRCIRSVSQARFFCKRLVDYLGHRKRNETAQVQEEPISIEIL